MKKSADYTINCLTNDYMSYCNLYNNNNNNNNNVDNYYQTTCYFLINFIIALILVTTIFFYSNKYIQLTEINFFQTALITLPIREKIINLLYPYIVYSLAIKSDDIYQLTNCLDNSIAIIIIYRSFIVNNNAKVIIFRDNTLININKYKLNTENTVSIKSKLELINEISSFYNVFKVKLLDIGSLKNTLLLVLNISAVNTAKFEIDIIG